MTETKVFSIKSDSGYGDWDYLGDFFSEKEAVEKFNELTGQEFTTAWECWNYDHPIYSFHFGPGEINHEWMDS